MNPVDHPHGGGEGRTSGGRHPVTPWGKPTKGKKTRNNKRTDEIHRALAATHARRSKGKHMTRSVWKGPFVDGYLLKKAEAARGRGRNEVIKIWSRRSTILPQFVGLTFGVYNGHKHIPVLGHRRHGRPQVRRVRADADLLRPLAGRQEGRRGSVNDGQAEARAARARRQRGARRSARMLRVSPQKLNLVAQLDPRQEGRERRWPTSTFSRKRIAARREKALQIGDRQRREQSRPRRRRSGRRRGHVGKALVMKRFMPARPRPRRPHREAVLAPDDRGARGRGERR